MDRAVVESTTNQATVGALSRSAVCCVSWNMQLSFAVMADLYKELVVCALPRECNACVDVLLDALV